MKKSLIAIATLALVSTSFAADPLINQTGACPTDVTGAASGSCTNQNQQLGDTTSSVTGDVQAPVSSTQQGVASASNASGNAINPNFDNKSQVTQNTTATTTGTISGGNTNSAATGGNATGNWSSTGGNSLGGASNGNQTMGAIGGSANGGNNSTGPSSSGGNTVTGGANTATTGQSHSGGNTMTGGANTANGGGGGGGGAGGMGGTGGNAEGGMGGTGGKSENTMKGESNSGRNTLSNGSSSGASANNGGNTTSSTSASGGNKLGQASKTSNDGSGNSQTNIDSSNRSVYNNKSIFIPPVVPPTPASFVAAGNVIKETSECGPLQAISERDVNGTFHGLFVNSNVHQGYHQELVPYRDENGNEQQYKEVLLPTHDGYRIFGHQVTQYTTVVGVSGARNVAIGGGGSSGSWGQGGMGTSSANQQLVTTIQLRLCDMGTIKYPYTLTVVKEVPVYREVEVKPKMQ